MRKLRRFGILIALFTFLLITAFQLSLPNIKYWQSDSLIGWRHTPNFFGVFSGPGFRAKVKFNQEGFRDIHRPLKKAQGILRIAVMGDSFVEALQVDEKDTLTAVLEKRLNSVMKAEVMNFGVSSFGTTNEYLTYEAYVKKYHPDFVVIVFSVNDFIENDKKLASRWPRIDLMNRGPYFYITANGDLAAEEFFPYKKGVLKNALSKVKILSFLRNLYFSWKVRRLKNQLFYRDEIALYGNKFSDETRDCANLTKAILKKFILSVINNKSVPIVCLSYPAYIIDPSRRDFLRQDGVDLSKIDNIDKPLKIIKDLCNSLDVEVVDIGEAQLQIYKTNSGRLFFEESHWNEAGHRLMADAMEKVFYEVLQRIPKTENNIKLELGANR